MALSRRFRSFLLLFVLTFTLFGLFTVNANGTPATIEHTRDVATSPVVLFYQANGQLLNSTNMHSAINLLRANGFRVLIVNQTLSSTSLAGVNVLIIPNPRSGFDFTAADLAYISAFMAQPNHGLFLLNNPLSINATLASTPNIMNALIDKLPLTFTSSQFEIADSHGVVLQHFDPINNTFTNILHLALQNSSTLSFSASTSIVTESNSVTTSIAFAQTGANTYAVNSTGNYVLQSGPNLVLGGVEDVNTTTRLALSGSTVMFSDLLGPNNDNKSWFNSANNSYAWLSIVQWLANNKNISGATAIPDIGLVSIIIAVIGLVIIVLGFFFFITGSDPNATLAQQTSYISSRKVGQKKEGMVGTKGTPEGSRQVSDQSDTSTDQNNNSSTTSSKKVKVRKN